MALALGEHATNDDEHRRHLTIARDVAIAFRAWAEAFGVAHVEANNVGFGTPEPKDRAPFRAAERRCVVAAARRAYVDGVADRPVNVDAIRRLPSVSP